MSFDEAPIDVFGELRVDVVVVAVAVRPAHIQTLPVANTRHQFDTKEIGEREDGFRLSLRVGMKYVKLDVAIVLEKAIKDVDRLPNAARDEVTEDRYVVVGDMVVTDPAIAAVADVVLGEKVLLVQIPAGAVG